MNKLLTFFCCLLFFVKTSYSQNSRPQVFPANSRDVIEEGIKLYDEGKFDDALSKLKQVSKSDTNYVWSLFETALTFNAKEQYDQVIKLCIEGIDHHTNNDLSFYCLLGSAYDNSNQTDKSLATFDEAITKFPQSYRPYFEKAGTYFNKKNYVEAEKLYEKSISLNFMHFGSHYNLARIYAANGYITQAALCYQTAILMDSQSKRSYNALLELEKVLTVFNISMVDSIKELKIDRTPFEEIEMLLQSNAALQKSYELKSDLDYKCLRQSQVILEKLGDVEGKGFVFDYYVPLYKELWKNNFFQQFTYYQTASMNKKAYAYVNKPEGKVKDFFDWVVKRSRELRDLHFNKDGKNFSTEYFNNGALSAVAEVKNDKLSGPYLSYYSSGYPAGKGNFNNGEKVGEWTYYDENGKLSKTENHTDSKNFTFKSFYDNGFIAQEGAFENDNYTGLIKNYSKSGALSRELTAVNNQIEGKMTNFYDFGNKRSEVSYTNGQREGIYTNYHLNGAIFNTGTYKNDKETGPYKEYYISGKIKVEGNMESDEYAGDWKWYNENGTLSKTGSYKNGKETGVWIYYDEDGKKNYENNFIAGQLDGISNEIKNDKIYNQFIYKNSKLKSYTSFLNNYTVNCSGKTNVTIYDENGKKNREGVMNDGEMEGLWRYYNIQGSLAIEINYSKGQKEGSYKYYHPNGKVKLEGTYAKDSDNGLCSYYFITGILQATGMYVNGNREGEWFTYQGNGKLKTKEYYNEGKTTGISENYRSDGTLEISTETSNDYVTSYSLFDNTEKKYETVKLKTGNGKFQPHHFNGKIYCDAEFAKGNRVGKSSYYYTNGQVSRIENYNYHIIHGPMLAYSPDGKLIFSGNYKFGKQDSLFTYFNHFTGLKESTFLYKNNTENGLSTWYNHNGSISSTCDYKDGERDGYAIYFDENGKNVRIRFKYYQGTVVSYSYLNSKGEFVPEIPINKDKIEVKAYYSSGVLSYQAVYENGLRQDKLIFYNWDGKIGEEEFYIDGERNGLNKVYYPNGVLQQSTDYRWDERNGLSKYYNEKGELIGEEVYEMGLLNGDRKKLAEDGKTMKTTKFAYGEPVL
ncbi:hypothetical protein C3K47_11405 [Solitalea longa]|uniref:Uncharacterized protein n=1 Tax=Solitalea longa TaxID=2079460 RepID=A0A2S5A244_9SPHI|nr:toxin-antitoxin system YwqK family antitoxin [Solitalea longa]POY36347.1 hypothetical protein C3K47_11405 [Solitalea longa]